MSIDTIAMGHADLPILPNFRMKPVSPVKGLIPVDCLTNPLWYNYGKSVAIFLIDIIPTLG